MSDDNIFENIKGVCKKQDFIPSWIGDPLSRHIRLNALAHSFSGQYFSNYGVESEFKCVISIYARKGFRDTTDVYIWIRRWSFLLPQNASSQHSNWKLFTAFTQHTSCIKYYFIRKKTWKMKLLESYNTELTWILMLWPRARNASFSSFLGKAILLIIYTHFWAGLPHNLHTLEKSSFSSDWHSAVLILVNWEKVLDSAKYAHNYQI